jgi:uroporphyrinogen-III synthase
VIAAAGRAGAEQGALAGRAIVVTRPAGQAETLADAIRAEGGEAVLFPTIEIRDTDDLIALDEALSHVAGYDWAFFVSPNAVGKIFARLFTRLDSWPQSVRVAAIGPGTRAALEKHGVRDVVAPAERYDSEGLMAMPAFAAVGGLRCVIFRGNGGREFIAATLAARGATVELVECYRRGMPRLDAAPLIARWSRGGIDAVTLTSSEGARNFRQLVGSAADALIRATPAFVPHQRIAAAARECGFREVIETGAADAGLLVALCRHFGADRGALR